MTRLVSLLVLVGLGGACTSSSPAHPASPASAPAPAISVEGTWASAGGPRTALVYFVVSNPTSRPDVLRGASSEVGGLATVRKTTAAGTVRPVDHVTVPAGGEVDFQPGGYDVALGGLKRAPTSGSVVRLTLRFENAGEIEVAAGVR